ncbi:MAG: hypothetical protein WCY16_09280 [Weeksellaceae bacterium]
MKNISLKLDESVFQEAEKIAIRLKISRNHYINEAVAFYNKFQKGELIEKKLKLESELVKSDSMSVLKEFEDIDYDS